MAFNVDFETVKEEIVKSSHGFAAGDVVRYNGSTWVKAQADSLANCEMAGMVDKSISENAFSVIFQGKVSLASGSWSAGTVYYMSTSSAGALTSTEPTGRSVIRPFLLATATNEGIILDQEAAFQMIRSINAPGETVNLYVSTTGSDTTGDGSSGAPWASLSKAMSFLDDCFIENVVGVNIIIGDGTYSGLSAIPVKQHHLKKLTIKGANTYTKSMTGITSATGSSGAWTLTLSLDTVTNIAVNDYVIVTGTANGDYPKHAQGCHKVTSVDSNTIDVLSKNLNASPPLNLVTGTVTVIKTILSFSSNGLQFSNSAVVGNLSDIVIAGPGTGSGVGIELKESSYLRLYNKVGVVSFLTGISSDNSCLSEITANTIKAVSGCATGLECSNMGYASFLGVASGCTTAGVSAIRRGVVKMVESTTGSVITGNAIGIYTKHFGVVIPRYSSIAGNTTGLYAEKHGYMTSVNLTYSENSTDQSPVNDTIGNDIGYISSA